MGIVPGVANPGHHGIANAFGWQAPTRTLRRMPPPQSAEHAKITDGIDPEGRGDPKAGDYASSERRTDSSADVESDTVRRNGRREVLFRDELRYDRLPGRRAQSPAHAYEEGEEQQYEGGDQIERHERGE